MKRITILSAILIAVLASCKNFEIEHPDFKYVSGFFPYQYPVRTLVLGDYIYDNTNDNNHKFVISISIGGVYANEKDRTFNIQVDNSLCENVLFSEGGDPIIAMPPNYYQLGGGQIVVPKGKVNGGVEVQLTDAFFSDPKAIKNTYVVPLRITGSNDVDTILSGRSPNPNADPRIAGDWLTTPKNFTMFAVKYINEYDGKYFRYGKSSVKNASGTITENTNYDTEKYVENYPVVRLSTTGRYEVAVSTFFQSAVMEGALDLVLAFNGNNCTVSAPDGSPYTVSGSGQFKSKEYNWGNKERDGIVLTYQVSDGINTYEANEVLVLRDRPVVLEVYSPVVSF